MTLDQLSNAVDAYRQAKVEFDASGNTFGLMKTAARVAEAASEVMPKILELADNAGELVRRVDERVAKLNRRGKRRWQ